MSFISSYLEWKILKWQVGHCSIKLTLAKSGGLNKKSIRISNIRPNVKHVYPAKTWPRWPSSCDRGGWRSVLPPGGRRWSSSCPEIQTSGSFHSDGKKPKNCLNNFSFEIVNSSFYIENVPFSLAGFLQKRNKCLHIYQSLL